MPEALRSLGPILSIDPRQGVAAVSGAPIARGAAPGDVESAKRQLQAAVKDALRDICDDTGKVGQATINNLLQLPLPELESAANVVLSELAVQLGSAVTKLFSRAVALVVGAMEKVMSVLGAEGRDAVRREAVGWIDQLKQGTLLTALLSRLYEIERMQGSLSKKLPPMPGKTLRPLTGRLRTLMLSPAASARCSKR